MTATWCRWTLPLTPRGSPSVSATAPRSVLETAAGTGVLTRELARMHSPHNVLATVIGGQIVDHPVVIRAVTTRWVRITGFPNRAAAEYALRSMLAG